MLFLRVFLTGGLFCLVTQICFTLTKRSIVTILTGTYCAGIILSALGIMGPVAAFGQSGEFLVLYGGGDAVYQGMAALLQGDPVPILRYVVLILYCFVVGIAGALVLARRSKK